MLIALLAVIIIFMIAPLILPPLKSILSGVSEFLCSRMNMEVCASDEYIRELKVENGLAGSVLIKYSFFNIDEINSYQLKEIFSEKKDPLSLENDVIERDIKTGGGDDIFRQNLKEGKEFVEEIREETNPFTLLPEIPALTPKTFSLIAKDLGNNIIKDEKGENTGEKLVEYKGIFAKDKKRESNIRAFEEFNKLISENNGALDRYNLDIKANVKIHGFNSQLNNGVLMEKRWLGGLLPDWGIFDSARSSPINMPAMCKDRKTCLCLCYSLSSIGERCKNDNLLCYGYDYDYIVGEEDNHLLPGERLNNGDKIKEPGFDNLNDYYVAIPGSDSSGRTLSMSVIEDGTTKKMKIAVS